MGINIITFKKVFGLKLGKIRHHQIVVNRNLLCKNFHTCAICTLLKKTPVFYRCLPMNLTAEDLASGALRDRVKVGASLADVDPMNLDSTVSI